MAEGRVLPVGTTEALLACGVISIMAIMILPVPPTLLDLLLSLSLTVSIVVLLIALFIERPLEFSTFPTMLLVVTLFRLAMNVASTRLILLHGANGLDAAGSVIKSFGSFVLGGNYVVGIVVFAILVLINFIVITKGSGRIAEVAARFTLDAMPGKQMAIDADLNAGLISEDEARRRRLDIAREADFYGAMDGASKFVRGDAVAGILITLINIIGGLTIGMTQNGMTASQALETYTVLTVGDGLVSQIPSLIVSTAAGLVVTRAGSGGELAGQFTAQFAPHPKAFALAGGFMAVAGLIPGMPTFPLFTLGAACAAGAWFAERSLREKTAEEIRLAEQAPVAEEPEEIETYLAVDALELEVGYELIHLVDTEQGGDLLDRIKSIRRRFAGETGFIVPQIHIRDNLQLPPGSYRIKIKGTEIASAELRSGFLMAMDPGGVTRKVKGVATKEPAFGLPALWILESQKEEAELAGYTVVDLSTVVATHLAEVIKAHAHELLTRQDVQRLLDNLAKSYPKTVEELVPETLSLGVVQKVLQNLLREGVSIRDLLTIVETLADRGESIKDPEYLTEYVRAALARAISAQHADSSGCIELFTLDGHVEQALRDAIERTDQGSFLNLTPAIRQGILTSLARSIERQMRTDGSPVVLCSPTVRAHFKRLTERFLPNLVVISHNEIDGLTKIRSIGSVGMEHAG